MKLEIKNIKVNKAFSQETICFTADVFVNGKKTGHASNDGHGGCTFYNAYEGMHEALTDAEAYAKTLPSHFYEYRGEKKEIKSNLENFIDYAIDDYFNAKEKASFEKKLLKNMETSICFGVPNGGSYRMIGYGKTPLRAVAMNNKAQVQNLIYRIKSELKTGEAILNTNLESMGLIV